MNISRRSITTLNSVILSCLLAFACTASKGFAHTKEQDTLVIGGVKYPPMAYIDDKGGIHGPAVDLLNTLFDELDRPYRWVGMQQNRLNREIANGHIDLTAATKRNNDIEDLLIFTKNPWACLRVNIFSAPGQPAISQLNELRGKNLVYYFYFDSEDLIAKIKSIPGIKTYSVNKRSSALKMLQAGRAEYYLDFHLPVTQAMKEMDVSLSYLNIFKEAGYVAAPKSKPESQKLIDRIDELLEGNKVLAGIPISEPTLLKQCVE